jgi:putative NADH-flavin reductase
MIKKVLIFGATGGTGVEIVRQSLKSGYDVSVFVRGKTESLGELAEKVAVYRGDVKDYTLVQAAIDGQDAVLVALGCNTG